MQWKEQESATNGSVNPVLADLSPIADGAMIGNMKQEHFGTLLLCSLETAGELRKCFL